MFNQGIFSDNFIATPGAALKITAPAKYGGSGLFYTVYSLIIHCLSPSGSIIKVIFCEDKITFIETICSCILL